MHEKTRVMIRSIKVRPKQGFGEQCGNIREAYKFISVLKCKAEQDFKHRA